MVLYNYVARAYLIVPRTTYLFECITACIHTKRAGSAKRSSSRSHHGDVVNDRAVYM